MAETRVCEICSRSLPLDRGHFHVTRTVNGKPSFRKKCIECYRKSVNQGLLERKTCVQCVQCGGTFYADRLRIPQSGYRCFKCACKANSKYNNADLRWYQCWYKMVQRCSDVTDPTYGGRGITVCDEWKDYEAFAKWAESVGLGDNGTTLDRIDPDKGYSPENCRPADSALQAMNRRSSRNYSAFGEVKPLTTWSNDERCIVSKSTIERRLRKGWPDFEEIITTKCSDRVKRGKRLWQIYSMKNSELIQALRDVATLMRTRGINVADHIGDFTNPS